MSIDIKANVTRAGTPVPPGVIAVQLDLMNQQDARAYGGASSGEGPFFRYNGYTLDSITLAQGDLLTDTVNVDPLTGVKKRYRVIGDPEFFIDNHWEIVVDRVIGT
jgi:hypothetical protein